MRVKKIGDNSGNAFFREKVRTFFFISHQLHTVRAQKNMSCECVHFMKYPCDFLAVFFVVFPRFQMYNVKFYPVGFLALTWEFREPVLYAGTL